MDTNAHEGGRSEEPRIARITRIGENGRRGTFARPVQRVGLPPNICAFRRLHCHRLRRSRSTLAHAKVERVVLNALATTRGSAVEYLRLPATRPPSSSEKPIHLRKQ